MLFTKLDLSGFKSFVDRTELLIEPGMTGIVGPNGCGKSNLVEALRWAMGESSARRLRGEEMDDLIFGGTVNRPARNVAEVTLALDNSARTAPAAFNDHDELEITRRIERGSGSHYRINGKEVRARDVQVLFADAATGSRSTALVSQGQVETIIQSKPINRRALLEEAAGITGLYSRRHEAELRLKAAETNLERLEDVVAALETQHANLKRQARQATRYKNLSEHIRKAEAAVLFLRWAKAQAAFADAGARLEAAGATVQELTRAAGAAAAKQAEAAAQLPELRQAEAEAAAALQRLTLARDALDQEEARVTAALEAARERLVQNAADGEREAVRLDDAKEAAVRLAAERDGLVSAAEEERAAEGEAEAALAQARDETAALEARLAELAERVAGAEARRADLANRMIALEARKTRLGAQLDDARATLESLGREDEDRAEKAALEAAIADARGTLEGLRGEGEAAERERQARERAEVEARDHLRRAEDEAARLRAEAEALTALLAVADSELWPPLIDALTVEPGFEPALGAALGEDLGAPADEAAPVHWRTLEALADAPPLPGGVAALASFVTAPKALARRLAQIGVVDDAATGNRLARDLRPGQRLVTRDGMLWRWDGYTIADAEASQSARRLAQRNRLKAIGEDLKDAERARAEAQAAFDAAAKAAAEAAETDAGLRAAMREAEAELEARREDHAARLTAAAETESRLTAAAEAVERLTADLTETETDIAEVKASQDALSDTAGLRARLEDLRDELGELRATQAERQRAYDLLAREAAARGQRIQDIGEEHDSWSQRAATAEEHLAELGQRRAAIEEEIAALADRPAEIVAERMGLADRLEAAEA
ncbi:MAG: AAA family ATPase, partial [Alphaproteobacteria bacterium]|nr:AAA family ATPase [Alphaproteobacteria bacterium]